MHTTQRFFVVTIIAVALAIWIMPSESVKLKSARGYYYDMQLDVLEIFNLSAEVFQNVNMRVKKFNRTTYVVNGSYEVLDIMDDRYSGILSVYTESGNDYKLAMPPMMFEKFCQSVSADQKIYPQLVAHSNLPVPGDCPYVPGSYWIKDYPGAIEEFPELPNNVEKFKFEMIIYRNRLVVGGGALYAIFKKEV